jgi:hypothetical protein
MALSDTPVASVTTQTAYWQFQSPFDFDNVGFSKALEPAATAAGSSVVEGMRYLSCADCDYAPLGFQDMLLDGVILVPADRLRCGEE